MDISKILKYASWYYKLAQNSANLQAWETILGLSNKLADPNGVANPTPQIDQALIATLVQEVDKMEEQERFPITRPESKSGVRNLQNDVRQYYFNLTNQKDMNVSIPDLQKVRNSWDNYKRSYLNENFFNELQLAKSEVPQEQQQKFEDRWLFWTKFTQQIEDTISNLEMMLKDRLVGSDDVAAQPEPV